MKPSRLPIAAACAALTVILAAALACGTARVPEAGDTFIAQCTWTLSDYEKKADELALRAETMQSPLREDAQYKVYLMNVKIEEGRARIEEFKTARGERRNELIAEVTAIMKEVKALYDEAVKAMKAVGE